MAEPTQKITIHVFPIARGDIVQLNPETTRNRMFAGCLMVVTEPKGFSAQGFVQALGENGEPGGQAYYRAGWEELEQTGGRVTWMPGGFRDGEEDA
jgi:hypothetical protein